MNQVKGGVTAAKGYEAAAAAEHVVLLQGNVEFLHLRYLQKAGAHGCDVARVATDRKLHARL